MIKQLENYIYIKYRMWEERNSNMLACTLNGLALLNLAELPK